MRLQVALIGALLMTLPLAAQTTTGRRVIRAYGEGAVSVRPDVARIALGVQTQAATAGDSAARNAEASAAVIAALRSLLGATADIRTVNYSLYQQTTGTPPTTVFVSNNIVEAVIPDLSLIGRAIDVAIAAGANRVDSLRMGLKDEDPQRSQALRLASQKARAKAESIASGLGIRTGAVVYAEEGISVRPLNNADARALAATTTPVETGNLEVRATVTLELEAVQ